MYKAFLYFIPPSIGFLHYEYNLFFCLSQHIFPDPARRSGAILSFNARLPRSALSGRVADEGVYIPTISRNKLNPVPEFRMRRKQKVRRTDLWLKKLL